MTQTRSAAVLPRRKESAPGFQPLKARSGCVGSTHHHVAPLAVPPPVRSPLLCAPGPLFACRRRHSGLQTKVPEPAVQPQGAEAAARWAHAGAARACPAETHGLLRWRCPGRKGQPGAVSCKLQPWECPPCSAIPLAPAVGVSALHLSLACAWPLACARPPAGPAQPRAALFACMQLLSHIFSNTTSIVAPCRTHTTRTCARTCCAARSSQTPLCA